MGLYTETRGASDPFNRIVPGGSMQDERVKTQGTRFTSVIAMLIRLNRRALIDPVQFECLVNGHQEGGRLNGLLEKCEGAVVER
jgi:hypothetical protein